MKPALRAFLQTMKVKISNTRRQQLENSNETLRSLNQMLNAFYDKIPDGGGVDQNFDDKGVDEFLREFSEFKETWKEKEKENTETTEFIEKTDKAIKAIEDDVIFMLRLLALENTSTAEITMPSLMDHFAKVLGFPFKAELVNNQIKFVLFYDKTKPDLAEKQRAKGKCFYHALVSLGIVEFNSNNQEDHQFTITVASNQVKNLLRLAQFDLMDEEKSGETLEHLYKQFRFILAELVETEENFSYQAAKLAALLEFKLVVQDPEIKITEEQRRFLTEAKENYQKIGNNPFPWIEGGVNKDSLLNEKNPETLLNYCAALYPNTSDREEKIGERLGCLRWISVNYSKLDDLVNGKNGSNPLNLKDKVFQHGTGQKQSEKSVGTQNLITPVQRLPRILLLTVELIKCVEKIKKAGKLNQQIEACLEVLRALSSEWLRETKRTNGVVGEAANHQNQSSLKTMFNVLAGFITTTNSIGDFALDANKMADSVIGHFRSRAPLKYLRSKADVSTDHSIHTSTTENSSSGSNTEPTNEANQDFYISSENMTGFEDALCKSMLFAGQQSYESEPLPESLVDNTESDNRNAQSDLSSNSSNVNQMPETGSIPVIVESAVPEVKLTITTIGEDVFRKLTPVPPPAIQTVQASVAFEGIPVSSPASNSPNNGSITAILDNLVQPQDQKRSPVENPIKPMGSPENVKTKAKNPQKLASEPRPSSSPLRDAFLLGGGTAIGIAGVLFLVFMPHTILFLVAACALVFVGSALVSSGVVTLREDMYGIDPELEDQIAEKIYDIEERKRGKNFRPVLKPGDDRKKDDRVDNNIGKPDPASTTEYKGRQ